MSFLIPSYPLELNVSFKKIVSQINCNTLQCKKVKVKSPLFWTKRASFLSSINKASMTVEASIVLPIFLFALLQLSTIFEIYQNQMDIEAKLHQNARPLAIAAHLTGLTGEECIDLYAIRTEKARFQIVPFSSFSAAGRCVIRGFTGYDTSKKWKTQKEEEIVFVTPTGTVYHKSKSCKYLDINVKCVYQDEITECRNKDGGKYYPCEACKKGALNLYYITDYGDRYHTSISCKKLKRTIEAIPISQAKGKHACSNCGG